MKVAESSPAWLQKLVPLLILSISAVRPFTYGGAAAPSRVPSASEDTTLHLPGPTEGDSQGTQQAKLPQSTLSTDGDWPNPEGNSQLTRRRFVPTCESSETRVIVDEETLSAGQHSVPFTVAEGCSSCSGEPRYQNGSPCPPTAANHPQVEVRITSTADASFSSRRSSGRPWWRTLLSRGSSSTFRINSASTRRRTPFGLNRFVLLVAYTVSSILSSGCFFAWPSLRRILCSQGAYSHACQRLPNGTFVGDLRSDNFDFICVEQEALVQRLYSIGTVIYCMVAVVGGIAYQRIGPRMGAVLGHVFSVTGWGLLSIHQFLWEPAVAVAFIAAAVPLISFPPFGLRHLFPCHEQAVMMVLSAAVSASVMVPFFIVEAARFLGTSLAVVGYIVVALLPSLCNAAFLIPWRDFSELEGRGDRITCSGESSPPLPTHRQEPGMPGERASLACGMRQTSRRALLRRVLCSRRFIVLAMYRTICDMVIGYYFQSSTRMLPAAVDAALGSILITSPLFCLLLGLASQLVSSHSLMIVTSLAGLASYVLPLIRPGDVYGYLSAISFALYLGTASAQSLAFLPVIADEQHIPILFGILVMTSGLLSSLSAPLYTEVTVQLLRGEYVPVHSACIAALVLQFFFLFILRPRRTPATDRTPHRIIARTTSLAAPSNNGDADSDEHGTD